jgi:tetratricopeptide (TPR) repeat protein
MAHWQRPGINVKIEMTQNGWLDNALERESANILGGRGAGAPNHFQRSRQLRSILDRMPQPELDNAFARESIDSIAYINRGALLLSLYGDLEKAAALCKKAIATCVERRTEHWGWEWMTITPYQNLGRVHALEGRCDDALAIFDGIYHFFVHQSPLSILEMVVVAPDEERRTVAQKFGDDFAETSPYAYLQTSARCYLMANRYPELLGFLNKLEASPGFARVDGFLSVLYEVYARTFLALSRTEEAMSALRQLSDLRSGQAITKLLLCQAHHQMQDQAQAFASMDAVAQWLLTTERYPSIYGYLCALWLARLGHLEPAKRVALSALHQCDMAGEEPGKMKVLALLAHICRFQGSASERQESSEWINKLLSVASTCEYQYEAGTAFLDAATLFGPQVSKLTPATRTGCLHRARELMAPLMHLKARLITAQVSEILGSSPRIAGEMPPCAVFPNPHAETIYARLAAEQGPVFERQAEAS